jgi:hypothetical protein
MFSFENSFIIDVSNKGLVSAFEIIWVKITNNVNLLKDAPGRY